MTGMIKRLVRDRGFGFIVDSDNREYFFHRTALTGERFEDLFEGQVVSFDVDDGGAKGPRATHISSVSS